MTIVKVYDNTYHGIKDKDKDKRMLIVDLSLNLLNSNLGR